MTVCVCTIRIRLGFSVGLGNEVKFAASAQTSVYGYGDEHWNTFANFYWRVEEFSKIEGAQVSINADLSIALDRHSSVINNGVQIYPYSPNALAFSDAAVKVFNRLKALLPKHQFNDMFAFSLVWKAFPASKLVLDRYTSSLHFQWFRDYYADFESNGLNCHVKDGERYV